LNKTKREDTLYAGPRGRLLIFKIKRNYVNRHYNYKFEKEMVVIGPGERFTSTEDLIISTVLGSCVAVSCFDTKKHFGGINHFMLPGDDLDSYTMGNTGKYGIHAMDLLFEDMWKLGAEKTHVEVKVFGGGAVLKLQGRGSTSVPDNNINFTFRVLKEKYNIPVAASDVGGDYGRKIFFFPATGRVMVKQLNQGTITPVIQEELQIIRELRRD
jgi:chemotaxis protein CheD